MSLAVFCMVLFAACLHATWNAIVKSGEDKWLSTVLVAAFAALAAAALLPWLPQPARASWPSIAFSAVLQVIYYFLVARAYHAADMSQAYPLMRGTAPILVALAAAFGFGEILSLPAWLGIGAICLGILSMLTGSCAGGDRRGVYAAMLNAVIIAGYTLIDGMGVRRSEAPGAYTLWIFLLTGMPLVGWACLARGGELRRYAARHWRLGLAGGLGTLVSYGLALWAMTLAPVAVVAALRETSILFGALISWLILGERLSARRWLAVGMIALGAMALRLS